MTGPGIESKTAAVHSPADTSTDGIPDRRPRNGNAEDCDGPEPCTSPRTIQGTSRRDLFLEECKAVDAASFARDLRQAALREHIPLSGSIELTRRCNLGCIHCYAGPLSEAERVDQMTRAQIQAIIDELVRLGCLELTLTGGEPLLRTDFSDIYRYAREAGLLVTVFTNGTLIDTPVRELFREFPPVRVEVSIYGATESTHDAITGTPGSYRACLNGVKRLSQSGIPLTLKTIIMRPNIHEFNDIEAMAGDFGASFRCDAMVFSRFDGNRSPAALRVKPEEAVAREFSNEKRRNGWLKIKKQSAPRVETERLYTCAAGEIRFHITCDGFLQPCLMTPAIRLDLSAHGFAAAWTRLRDIVRGKMIDSSNVCKGCSYRFACQNCPGYACVETGHEAGVVPFLCSLAALRAREFRKNNL